LKQGRKEANDLASDDGDGGERLPEGREVGSFSTSVVSEGGAGSLDAVHQADQTLHARHRLPSCLQTRSLLSNLCLVEPTPVEDFEFHAACGLVTALRGPLAQLPLSPSVP
jgi:hypothetical protein